MSQGGTTASQILISYAHESSGHVERVRKLSELLVAHGLEVRSDQPEAADRQNWARWTVDRIREADRVLVVVSPAYRRRFERGADADAGRGVQFEGLLISEEIFKDPDSALRKFLPVLLPGTSREDIPTVLLPYSGTSYPIELTAEGVAGLVGVLKGEEGAHRAEWAPGGSRPNGRRAALHLLVSSAQAGRADDIVRAFLACGAETSGVEFDADTVPSGAMVTGSLEQCATVLSSAMRPIQRIISGAPGAATANVRVGAHVAGTATGAIAVATRLSLDPAAVRLHGIPGARLVVVVSEEFREQLGEAVAVFPRWHSYRPLPAAAHASWFAIAGRARAPEPGSAPEPDPELAGSDSADERAAHIVVGVNNGHVSGRDMTLTIVNNYGGRR
jgi:hypothetical protein